MHPKLTAWEDKLRTIFEKIDAYLEEKYGAKYPLHPARARRGATSGGEYDGLFSVDGVFTPGFGSDLGRGYILRVQIATLADVPEEIREAIERDAADRLKKELPKIFPDRKLTVERDGHSFKIIGDLSLGEE